MSSLRYCDCEHLSLQLRVVFAVWKFWCGITDNRSRGRIGQRAQRSNATSARQEKRKNFIGMLIAHCSLANAALSATWAALRQQQFLIAKLYTAHSRYFCHAEWSGIRTDDGLRVQKKQPSNFYHCQHEMSVHKCRTSEMTTIRNDSPNTVRIQFAISKSCNPMRLRRKKKLPSCLGTLWAQSMHSNVRSHK